MRESRTLRAMCGGGWKRTYGAAVDLKHCIWRFGQGTEAVLGCNMLNQMTQLCRPASYIIGR